VRVEQAMLSSAGELIGGDVGVAARKEVPRELRAEADRLGLRSSEAADFPTVLFANEQSQMANVRAVDASYPLRGELRVRDGEGRERRAEAPPAGGVYLEHRVLVALRLAIGDPITIGTTTVRVAGEIVREPDGGQLFSLAPRALVNRADVDASGLLGPGSRARYRLMVAGDDQPLASYREYLAAHLPEGAELITVERSQQTLRRAIERGEAFLRLCALLAALLSGVAVALAARRYARRKIDEVALLRCLGASRREVLAALLATLAILAVPACLFGALLGLALQEAVLTMARDLLPGAAPSLVLGPSLAAAAVGLAVLLGFALPPLLRLGEVPPIRVFQRAVGMRVRRVDVLYLLPVAVSAALIYQQSGAWRVAASLSTALLVVILGALGAAAVLIALARRFGRYLPGALVSASPTSRVGAGSAWCRAPRSRCRSPRSCCSRSWRRRCSRAGAPSCRRTRRTIS
jgi:putative ABC transport system permease protein